MEHLPPQWTKCGEWVVERMPLIDEGALSIENAVNISCYININIIMNNYRYSTMQIKYKYVQSYDKENVFQMKKFQTRIHCTVF